MDAVTIGAAVKLAGGAAASAAQAANTAATNATNAANAANTATTGANNAKNAANNAAAAANAAAANYSNLDKDAFVDRTAFNYAYTLLQAELRDAQKRLAAAEAALAALT